MKQVVALMTLAATLGLAQQETKVAVGISGWTGFAPLTLAKEAGLFKKHGLDVTIKKIPQKDRHLAIAVGRHPVRRHHGRDLDRLERQRRGHDADLPARQELRRRRHGGQAEHHEASDLKGKTVAADAPGTAPYFTLAWMLKKNGLSIKDVKVVNLSRRPPPTR
jgi:NitT/TauT family transport system substrate-binding protein